MVAFPALPEISDEESEWLESIFNSEYHGEMRIERDDLAKRFTINWFDSCISELGLVLRTGKLMIFYQLEREVQ